MRAICAALTCVHSKTSRVFPIRLAVLWYSEYFGPRCPKLEARNSEHSLAARTANHSSDKAEQISLGGNRVSLLVMAGNKAQ